MSVDTLTSIRLGYGGKGFLNGTQVLITSGSMESSVSIQHQSMYSMPNTNESRSRVLHSDGTVQHTGSISLDLTTSALDVIKSILIRNKKFSVSIYDGTFGKTMNHCVATSIEINGQPSGFITATVSFMSDFPSVSESNSSSANNMNTFMNEIIPYWWSGNSYVRDWGFTFNQQVTPKYGNKNLYKMTNEGVLASSPLYLFVGETDCSLDFTTFCPLISDKVYIANSVFRFSGRTNSNGFSVSGANDLGMYKYNIISHALGNNENNVLVLT